MDVLQGSDNAQAFSGEIDEIRIFNRRLEHQQIMDTHGRGISKEEFQALDGLLSLDFDRQDLSDQISHEAVVGSLGSSSGGLEIAL